jgi:DNA/RNA endonuclease YhcR with UshA esterase domain
MNPRARSVVRVLAVLLVLAGSPAALLCRGEASISAWDAREHVGEERTVCGEVVSTRYAHWARGAPTFLNFGRPYPDQVFTVVIWGDDRRRFEDRPEERFLDRRVCVGGRIGTYRGTPQIVVRRPEQIEIVDGAGG